MSTQSTSLDAVMSLDKNSSQREKRYFGQINIKAEWVEYSQKDKKFIVQAHQTSTAMIYIEIDVRSATKDFVVSRKFPTFTDDWTLLRNSLLKVGHTPSTIDGLFVEVSLPVTGKYEDRITGETKQKTGLCIERVFKKEEDCFTARDAFFNKKVDEQNSTVKNEQPTLEQSLKELFIVVNATSKLPMLQRDAILMSSLHQNKILNGLVNDENKTSFEYLLSVITGMSEQEALEEIETILDGGSSY
jgi:hypothetical protein